MGISRIAGKFTKASNDTGKNKIYPINLKSQCSRSYSYHLLYTKGNFVFNAGTCFWSMLLSMPPGYQKPVCNQGEQVIE
jgi:hypothetical protein